MNEIVSGALIVAAVISMLLNVMPGGMNAYSEWLSDIVLTGPAVVRLLLTFSVEAKWAQRLGAILVALMTTYFLVAASAIGVQ